MNEECWMCQDSKQLIREYEYWKIFIHPNQYYLGRMMIALKRHIEDLTEINSSERNELFDVLGNLRRAIITLFEANLFNYASLGNETRHLHIHFIPRYDHEVIFDGIKFKDENWNKNYVPYPKDFKIPQDILDRLKQEINANI